MDMFHKQRHLNSNQKTTIGLVLMKIQGPVNTQSNNLKSLLHNSARISLGFGAQMTPQQPICQTHKSSFLYGGLRLHATGMNGI